MLDIIDSSFDTECFRNIHGKLFVEGNLEKGCPFLHIIITYYKRG